MTNGTEIPTFEEVLKAVQGQGTLFIHIKGNGKSRVLSKTAQNKIVKLLKKYNMNTKSFIFASESKMKKLNSLA